MNVILSFPVCIGCPSGWVCCGRVWGACVCTHPGWDSCCTRITDPLCLAANAACALLKKPLDLVLQGVIKVVDNSRWTLDVAKGVLSAAQGVITAAKKTLDLAIAALDVVKATYRIGVNAISALTRFVLTKIINIRELYFKVQLSKASGGVFQCRVKGVLMGQNINLSLEINTKDIMSIARSLAEKAVRGISKFIG